MENEHFPAACTAIKRYYPFFERPSRLHFIPLYDTSECANCLLPPHDTDCMTKISNFARRHVTHNTHETRPHTRAASIKLVSLQDVLESCWTYKIACSWHNQRGWVGLSWLDWMLVFLIIDSLVFTHSHTHTLIVLIGINILH